VRFRAQPPVHSPLSLRALGSGVLAAVSRVAAGGARTRVLASIRAEYGPESVALTDSGTSALALALRVGSAARAGPAALPAFCCYDIATATDAAGVPFLLYDVDPQTLGPDPASLERALEAGAGTVVVVHLYGVPVDVAELAQRLSTGAILVEDAAQAVGTRIRGRPAGSFGYLAVLSFGRGKGTTAGRGGALLANDPLAAASIEQIQRGLQPSGGSGALGLVAQWILARPPVYGVPASLPFLRLGETLYHAPHPPGSARNFALGVLAQTQLLAPEETAVRRRHANRLAAALASAPVLQGYSGPAGTEPGYLRFPLLVSREAAAAVRGGWGRNLGVWASYPLPLADLPGFGERRLNRAESFPKARELAERLVTLPVHSGLATYDLEALERWIERVGQGAIGG
jgi:perosamine synthetase